MALIMGLLEQRNALRDRYMKDWPMFQVCPCNVMYKVRS